MNVKMGKKDVLQAVVLADDFTTNLTPAQSLYPSILMPVINIPLMDYLLETLIKSRVQELYLYCSSHVDLLKSYAKQKKSSKLSISLIISDGCRSLGDALRDIDTKGWIRGNFILIRGDSFINADLGQALNIHRARLEKDKGATMSMVLRNIGSTNDSNLKDEACLVVSDKSSKKLLHYIKLKKDEKKAKLELNWFLDHNELEINTCFLDTHVYLCSASVLPLFADNFDFQTMEDFIRGVLMNEEILDSRIYWQRLNSEDYSLPILSWNAYHTLNQDIIRRHTFPLTPKAFASMGNFMYMLRNTYKHTTAALAKGCMLVTDSILCQNSVLGNNTLVTGSVIGDDSVVGSNVVIKDSYILPNVRIGDNCILEGSIVFPNSVIRKDAQLNGCILYPGTNVDAETEYTNSTLESKESDTGLCATKMSDIDSCRGFRLFKNHQAVESDNYSTDESGSDEDSERNSPLPDDTNMFLSEVIDSLLRGYQDKLNCENMILEINSSRYAYNVTMREVTFNVIKAILSLPLHYLAEIKESVTKQSYQRNLILIVGYFMKIIFNYVKTEDAQTDCLRAIEEVASTTQELIPLLQHLLHLFYDRRVLSEEKILEWYETSDNEFQDEKVRIAAQPFIKWLEEAEEDSSATDDD